MNRRGEWGENLPPKFGVLGGEEDREERGTNSRKRVQLDTRRETETVPSSKRRRGDDEEGSRGEGIRGTSAGRKSEVGKGQPEMGTNQKTLVSFVSVVKIKRE